MKFVSEEPQIATVQFNESHLNQLVDMGFPLEACKRALHSTQNESLEVATNWLMEHIDDPVIYEPFEPGTNSTNPGAGGMLCVVVFSLGYNF